MTDLNFYTVATGKYNIFIVPYIMTALWSNPNSTVEILTNNIKFVTPNLKSFLNEYFKERWLIKKIPKQFASWFNHSKKIKSIRWLTQPEIAAKYTYIGDIDLPTLEDGVLRKHAGHAAFINRPYSNIVRTGPKQTKKKVTGLHFVCTKEYYNKLTIKIVQRFINGITKGSWSISKLDECLLYILIQRFIGLPPKEIYSNRGAKPWERVLYRPRHGIHMSFGRAVGGWGVTNTWLQRINMFKDSQIWKDSQQFVDKKFKQKFSDSTLKKAAMENQKRSEARRLSRQNKK